MEQMIDQMIVAPTGPEQILTMTKKNKISLEQIKERVNERACELAKQVIADTDTIKEICRKKKIIRNLKL